MKMNRWLLILGGIILLPVLGFVAVCLLSWAGSFVDGAPEQDRCAFGAVGAERYQDLLRQAKGQPWTVWPGLSNGIFWASDRGIRPQSRDYGKWVADQLLAHVRELSSGSDAADEQLAATHAVLRSIGAEYVRMSNIPDFKQDGVVKHRSIHYWYIIPQRRFAPLCIHCFIWSNTSIIPVFRLDVAAARYTLDRFVVLHSGLKGDPTKGLPANPSCPSFPDPKSKHSWELGP